MTNGETQKPHDRTDDGADDGHTTEDARARDRLGPQGVPGKPDSGRMTPQADEQTPRSGDFDGHVA